jgi:hypothetical protein
MALDGFTPVDQLELGSAANDDHSLARGLLVAQAGRLVEEMATLRKLSIVS